MDIRDRPDSQATYVAEDNILLIEPIEVKIIIKYQYRMSWIFVMGLNADKVTRRGFHNVGRGMKYIL